MLARQLNRTLKAVEYDIIGDNANRVTKQEGNMYKGPEWFTSGANGSIYGGIYR